MGDFGKKYDPAEIYSDSETSKSEKSLGHSKPTNNNLNNASTATKTSMKVFKITDSNFYKLYKSLIGSKQTHIV